MRTVLKADLLLSPEREAAVDAHFEVSNRTLRKSLAKALSSENQTVKSRGEGNTTTRETASIS